MAVWIFTAGKLMQWLLWVRVPIPEPAAIHIFLLDAGQRAPRKLASAFLKQMPPSPTVPSAIRYCWRLVSPWTTKHRSENPLLERFGNGKRKEIIRRMNEEGRRVAACLLLTGATAWISLSRRGEVQNTFWDLIWNWKTNEWLLSFIWGDWREFCSKLSTNPPKNVWPNFNLKTAKKILTLFFHDIWFINLCTKMSDLQLNALNCINLISLCTCSAIYL